MSAPSSGLVDLAAVSPARSGRSPREWRRAACVLREFAVRQRQAASCVRSRSEPVQGQLPTEVFQGSFERCRRDRDRSLQGVVHLEDEINGSGER
jgi:hypothetical protein